MSPRTAHARLALALGGALLAAGAATPTGAHASGAGSPAAPPAATPTATPAPATIYGDTLGAGWQATPWDGTANVAATAPAYAGARSIAFTATAGWGGLSLHHAAAGVNTAPYAHLTFALRATQAGQANSDGTVREYATNAAYKAATAGFLQAVKAELGAALLWANLTSGADAPSDWDAHPPYLDGG